MNTKLIFTACLLVSFSAFSQIAKNYKDLAKKKGANYYEIVAKAQKEFEAKDLKLRGNRKANKHFNRWKLYWEDKVYLDGSFPNENLGYFNASILDKSGKIISQQNLARNTEPAWTNVGPKQSDVNNNGYTNYPQMGRLNAFLRIPHPTDVNQDVLFVGAPNGGIWKSTDGGANWTPKLDKVAAIGVTDIATVPGTNTTNYTTRPIYVSTGDYDGDNVKSIGVLKSTDGGESFSSTGLSYSIQLRKTLGDLVVIDANTVFVGEDGEIKKTTDGGQTWSVEHDSRYSGVLLGRAVRNGNEIMFAGNYLICYTSDYTSPTSQWVTIETVSGKKAAAVDANGDFFIQELNGQIKKLNKTTKTFTNVGNIPTSYNAQGGFNQALLVDGSRIISGEFNGQTSYDNGSTWYRSLNGYWHPNPPHNGVTSDGTYIHSDHHGLGKLGANKYWSVNDGGLNYIDYSSSNTKPAIEYKSSKVLVTQSYSVAINPTANDGAYVMANQDNDAFSKKGTQWYAVAMGDGIQSAINYNNPNIRYAGNQSGYITQTNTAFEGQLNGNGKTVQVPGANFYYPLEMDKTNPDVLYAGGNDVYKITYNTSSNNLSIAPTNTGISNVQSAIKTIATHGNSVMTASKNVAKFSTNQAGSWTTINLPTNTSSNITSVDFSKTDNNIRYITYGSYSAGKKVYKTTNGGTSWTNISGDLPNIVVKEVLLEQGKTPETLYLATELGVYKTVNGGTNWTRLGTGLPNVDVRDIEMHYTANKLVAATFGRGLWEVSTGTSSASTTRYVTQAGAGTKDGSSWANASDNLQAMINASSTGNKIFVAKGIYKPSMMARTTDTGGVLVQSSNSRDVTFHLKEGVKIYGGFDGTETGDETTRSNISTTNKTTLSGDIGTVGDNNDNAYHVVLSVSDTEATVLDGFTITGGNANGSNFMGTVEQKNILRDYGGGMYNTYTKPSLMNITFSVNNAKYGGAMSNNVSSSSITNTIFIDNTATSRGGGMHNDDNSSPIITNAIFSRNKADVGGGMNNSYLSRPIITNTTFSENRASANGGGLFNRLNSFPKIYNSIFWDNKKGSTPSATASGADIENVSSSIVTIANSLTQVYGSDGTNGNIVGTGVTKDPLFVNPAKGDFRLQPGSPAINVGDNSKIASITIDANGKPRRYNTTAVDMGAYEHQDEFNYWNGATNTNWATTSNWSKSTLPTNTDTEPTIIKTGGTNMPVISGTIGLYLNNLIVQNGASFTIQGNATLRVNGYARGEFTYNHSMSDKWHLIAVPLSDEAIEDVRTNNSSLATSGNKIAFATYNNLKTTNPRWVYYLNTSTGNLTKGKGYSSKLTSSGAITFKGNLRTANVTYTLAKGTSAGQQDFNLIGNPFTAYFKTANLLSSETANIEGTIWVWNPNSGTNGAYEAKNQAHNYIAPTGQAFFVKAKTSNAITFATSMLTGATSSRTTTPYPLVTLNLTDGSNNRYAEVFYINGKTKNFDSGYDSETFDGIAQDFEVYTDLLISDGKKYAVQTLPNVNHSDMIIPIGLIAEAGKELSFSATITNLPSDLEVYLEDRVNGTFTKISQETHKITLEEAATGLGQFYMHLSSKPLSTNTITKLEGVNIFKASNSNSLVISGLTAEKAVVRMVNVLGKEVFTTQFTATGNNTIALPKMATGVYIVKVNSTKGNKTKKIVIE